MWLGDESANVKNLLALVRAKDIVDGIVGAGGKTPSGGSSGKTSGYGRDLEGLIP